MQQIEFPRPWKAIPAKTDLTDTKDLTYNCEMQTTLRIDDQVFRSAKAEAARLGMTLTRFIEDALRERIAQREGRESEFHGEIAERERLMESLLQATAHFRVGAHPTREEMNGR
jgi:hypothetical protein